MINSRLIKIVDKSVKYIFANVAFQWFSLVSNIAIIFIITSLLEGLYKNSLESSKLILSLVSLIIILLIRFICTKMAARMSYHSSQSVKSILRDRIYEKVLRLGLNYREKVSTAEVVQIAVEGVEQLETYFGAYLPQLIYSMLAPLTLFIVVCFISVPIALVLLVCVLLIPISIAVIQTIAKKLFSKYWGEYTQLGDSFLENLQGLTTLKIYCADDYKHKEMNEHAESFRKITMRVLTMQLNSIILMDFFAYGGAALGIILVANGLNKDAITLSGAIAIILLSADFYIPMRLLGSFFHIAMNGMASADKIFNLLDMPEGRIIGTREFPKEASIMCRGMCFSYDGKREIIKDLNIDFSSGSFTAIVGESGCGKSTIASILMGRSTGYKGSITIGGIELTDIKDESLMKNITYIGHESYLFKGSVRDNLYIANPNATDEDRWKVLEQVKLADFLREESGLDTMLLERACNLSGGQRQRLALARALLHDSQVYIFDEATSNVDVESENEIMEQIYALAELKKTVILITHRLANANRAEVIHSIVNGEIVESGSHNELVNANGVYAKLWHTQQSLERYGDGQYEI